MKKQFLAILVIAFILSSFAACKTNGAKNQESSSERISNTSETEITKGIYGKTEIPDVPHEGIVYEESILKQCLDQMTFETHVFGDYKISLVGDNVRTDNAKSPDIVYVRNLRVEVEKNGVKLDSVGYYNDTVLGGGQITEYTLFKNRIGSYLDAYELNNPVIAMRYFNDDSTGAVTKMVEFVTIINDAIYDGFVGLCQNGTGIVINDSHNTEGALILNKDDNTRCRVSIFASEEFKIIDKNTLADEEAGIRYVFNFSNPPQMELYTAEKITD